MKQNIEKYRNLLLLLVLLCNWSCRKELCYDHNHIKPESELCLKTDYDQKWRKESDEKIDPEWIIDWDQVIPDLPLSICLTAYLQDDQGNKRLCDMPANGGILSFYPATYNFLLFNNDTRNIRFQGDAETMWAFSTPRLRDSYTQKYPDEQTCDVPDMLFAAYLSEITVPDTIQVTLQPRVFTYIIRYEFDSGLEYVSLARGALTGMSESVLLSSGDRSGQPVTLLYDCQKTSYGVESIIRSFGCAKAEEPQQHRLSLELLLTNGTQKVIELNVSDQVTRQPLGGIIEVKGLSVSDEEGEEILPPDFDTSVDGWGDNTDVVVPIY